MATTITVGTGGDYTNPASAWNAYSGGLTDDVVFDIISDVTATGSGMHIVVDAASTYSVKWTCSHNEANKEDWQSWYKITVGTSTTFGFQLLVSNGTTLDVEYLYLQTVGSMSNKPILYPRCEDGTATVRDCYLFGHSKNDYESLGVYIFHNTFQKTSNYSVYNTKIRNVWKGVQCYHVSSGGSIALENCSVDDTIYGVWTRGTTGRVTIRNTLSVNANTCYYDFINERARPTFENCTADDGTITSNHPFSTITDCIENITPADEFISLDETDSDYLQLKTTSQLADAGTAPTYAGGEDILGNDRPNGSGDYAIGCHEIVTVNTEGYKAIPKYRVGLKVQGKAYRFNNPQYGYTTTIHIATHITPVAPKGYTVWDDGSSYDYRTCRAEFLLYEDDAETLIQTITDDAYGRGIDCNLILQEGSGFYPFGPDKGDSGTFGVRIVRVEPGPVQEEPWRYFRIAVEMVATSYPGYVLPTEVSEGDLQIGTITGLRYPPDFPKSLHNVLYDANITRDGSPYTTDYLQSSDNYETSLPMVCNHSKSAALVNHLVSTVRGSTLSVVGGDNTYLFGRIPGDSGTYTCRWIDSSLKIVHVAYNRFSFDLNFYRVS